MPSSAPRRGAAGRALLFAALLAPALVVHARAQDGGGGDAPGGQQDQVSTAMVALLAAVVAVFVFIASATIYLRHCSGRAPPPPSHGDTGAAVVGLASRSSWSWWQPRRRWRASSRGLDAEVVEAFPTMTYAEAKALRVGKGGDRGDSGGALECAVCLSEFEDGERLRVLLPRCSHAFHPDCIGEWLAGHVTCPVCRCNLEPASHRKDATTTSSNDGEPTGSSFPPIPVASSISSETAAAWQHAGPLPVAVVIDVATDEEEVRRQQEALELQRIGTQRRAMRSRPGSGPAAATTAPPQLARWQSLAARLDRDLERFTLRLPEHVRREIVAAAAERSLELRRAGGGGGSGGRSAPLVGSGWQSLLGTAFSGSLSFFSAPRVALSCSGGGDAPSSPSSYTRLRGKRVAAVHADGVVPANKGRSTGPDSAGVGVGGGGSGEIASREVAAAADVEMEVKK